MRSLSIVLLVATAACGGDDGQFEGTKTYEFGPYTIEPSQEINGDCVQISLDNEEYANFNVVELTTGVGFHHSNWFYVPDATDTNPLAEAFPGPDGTFNCDERGFDQAIAAIKGGVFFAQSTQTPHEIQKFPTGVAVRVPPHSKLVAQIHLLNPSDARLTLNPNIKVTYIKDEDMTTRLAGMAFDNQALGLPPNMSSKFTVFDCDIATAHKNATATTGTARLPDFKIYYALAHYHELGTGLTVEALKDNGEVATVYSTATRVGDTLGGPLNPLFDFTGYTKLRFSCNFYNPRSNVVGYGVGDQEMCTFLAFTDSQYNFGGGILQQDQPGSPVMVGNTMTYSNMCAPVFTGDADRG